MASQLWATKVFCPKIRVIYFFIFLPCSCKCMIWKIYNETNKCFTMLKGQNLEHEQLAPYTGQQFVVHLPLCMVASPIVLCPLHISI
uniref:Uncharacterized protein n=1 Tax=Ixodes ricinus TaxID=34613 RepID=A0A6B0U8N7_IXORI